VFDGKALLLIELLKVGRGHHANRLIGCSHDRTRCSVVRARFLASTDGPRVGALAFDGWDTHVNEGAAGGRLADLLGALDGALAAIETNMGAAWHETVVALVTEFGGRRASTAMTARTTAPPPWRCSWVARSMAVASSPIGRGSRMPISMSGATSGGTSNLTDEEWAVIEPLIPPPRPGGGKRRTDMRAVVNGLMYILSTGCQWRALPKDFPPRGTVYNSFVWWRCDHVLDRIHHALYIECRERAERDASPTAARR
jgi:transposase